MSEFEIVSDDLRASTEGRGNLSEATLALLDGKTIKVSQEFKSGRFTNTLRRRGFKLRQRKMGDGLVLWAEPLPEEKPSA